MCRTCGRGHNPNDPALPGKTCWKCGGKGQINVSFVLSKKGYKKCPVCKGTGKNPMHEKT